MIGFFINMMMFFVNLTIGFAFGFEVWTIAALAISAFAAVACLAIESY